MKLALSLLASHLLLLTSSLAAPSEVWLTPQRAAQLRRITSRPYVTAVERSGTNAVYRWTNGAKSWTTTQAVSRVTGKPARNAWQDRLDAARAEKRAILAELKAVQDKPTAKALKEIVGKHDK